MSRHQLRPATNRRGNADLRWCDMRATGSGVVGQPRSRVRHAGARAGALRRGRGRAGRRLIVHTEGEGSELPADATTWPRASRARSRDTTGWRSPCAPSIPVGRGLGSSAALAAAAAAAAGADRSVGRGGRGSTATPRTPPRRCSAVSSPRRRSRAAHWRPGCRSIPSCGSWCWCPTGPCHGPGPPGPARPRCPTSTPPSTWAAWACWSPAWPTGGCSCARPPTTGCTRRRARRCSPSRPTCWPGSRGRRAGRRAGRARAPACSAICAAANAATGPGGGRGALAEAACLAPSLVLEGRPRKELVHRGSPACGLEDG